MDNEYNFFSFGDDEFTYFPIDKQKGKGKYSSIYKDFMEYTQAENDLETMIKDEIVEIYVDNRGTFHYYPSNKLIESLGQFKDSISKRFTTFAEMLHIRNLNIDRYNRYKKMLRGWKF